MRFRCVNKAPEALGIKEQTKLICFGKFLGLMVRRSKKGYQVGVEGNWSVIKSDLVEIPDTEIELIKERM